MTCRSASRSGSQASFQQQLDQNLPGSSTFVENLSNVKKARPPVEQYPAISEAMGQAIVAVLLGKAQPGDALDEAAAGHERRAERRLGPVSGQDCRAHRPPRRRGPGWRETTGSLGER